MSFVVYNDSYSPSAVVRQVHAILHLDPALQREHNDFDITIDSTWNDYTRSLLPIPIICMSIGLLAVLAFLIGSCCACCFRKPNTEVLAHGNTTLRYLRIAFILAFIVVLFYDQSIIFGNKYLSDGVSTADDGLSYLENTFTLLNDYGDELIVDGNNIAEDFSNSATINNCDEAETLSSFLPDYFSAVEDYLSYVSDVPDKCNNAQDALHKYGVEDKNKTIWVFYGMFLVCLAIYSVGMSVSNKFIIFGGFCITDIVLFVTFILCGVTMIILMLLADFCMDPVQHLLMIAPDSVYNVTAYYTTCAGSNPLDPSLQEAEDIIAQGQVAVQEVLDNYCPGDNYLEASLVEMEHITQIFDNITALTACPPTQQQALSVLNDGLCDDTFKGTYAIWLGMFVCAAGLLGASVIAACAYPHFDAQQQPTGAGTNRNNNSTPSGGNFFRPSSASASAPTEDSEESARTSGISYEPDSYARSVQIANSTSNNSSSSRGGGSGSTAGVGHNYGDPVVFAVATSPVQHPPVATVISAEPVDKRR